MSASLDLSSEPISLRTKQQSGDGSQSIAHGTPSLAAAYVTDPHLKLHPPTSKMSGETGPIDVSLAIAMVIAGFFSVAVFNAAEIFISIFSTFSRRSGLYFWSLLVSTFGILIHSIAVFLRFFALAPNLAMCVLTVLGWWAMVTGQSVVLYSRLGLVVCDRTKTRLVCIMIIFNFCILHIPVSVLFLASNSGNPDPYIGAFNIYEKIQLAGFSLQESIISGLYVWEAVTSIKPILAIKGAEGRRILRHLVFLFIITVLLDSSLLITEYLDHFQIQTTYKPVVYSIKLKIEFVILNELIAFTRRSTDQSEFLDSQTGKLSRTFSGGVILGSMPSAISRDSTHARSYIKLKGMKGSLRDHNHDNTQSGAQTSHSPVVLKC